MLAAIRKAVEVPDIRIEGVALGATTVAFVWLLAEGFIQPIAIYLLEIFLVF